MNVLAQQMAHLMEKLDQRMVTAGRDDHHAICTDLADNFDLWETVPVEGVANAKQQMMPMWLMYVVAGAMRDAGLSGAD